MIAFSEGSEFIALIQVPADNPKTLSGKNKTGARLVLVKGESVPFLRSLVTKQIEKQKKRFYSFLGRIKHYPPSLAKRNDNITK